MFAVATDSFYKTKNEAVFSASKSESIKRNVVDFHSNNTKNSVHFFSNDKEISLNLSGESIELLKSILMKMIF